MDVLAVRLALD